MSKPDALFRRLERNAVVFCGAATVVALVAAGVRAALGVLAGGALIGVSYWALKSSLDGFMRAVGLQPGPASAIGYGAASPAFADGDGEASPRRYKEKIAVALAKFVGRYALLALMAYVMIARLRLHPVGLLVGASSIVAAAGIEAGRNLRHRRI